MLISRLESIIKENARMSKPGDASQAIQDLGTHSASFALYDGDEDRITSHCFTGGPYDTSTRFQACSISKAVAALAVFRLIDQSLLSLHASITEYLDPSDVRALETDNTRDMAKEITLSHLLSHTSGLEPCGSFGFPGYDMTRDQEDSSALLPSLRQIVAGLRPSNTLPLKLRDWPGHRFNYSGAGFVVLQMILENTAGKAFADAMRDIVFRPLGMESACYSLPSDTQHVLNSRDLRDDGYARAYYNGYTPCEATHRVNPEQAAAGLWCTPVDLLRVAAAVQNSLHGLPGAFLKQRTAETMLTEVQDGMAHSWFVNATGFRHAGSNMPGWRCNLIGFRTTRDRPARAVAIMTNSQEGTAVYSKILAALCYLQGWPLPFGTMVDEATIIPFADVSASVDSTKSFEAWQGTWAESGNTRPTLQLQMLQDRPHVCVGNSAFVPLYVPAHPQEARSSEMRVMDDLVCKDGFEILIRLLETYGGEKLVQVWNGNTNDRTLMKRTSM